MLKNIHISYYDYYCYCIFGTFYGNLTGCKDCHWEPIMWIMHISLARDCQILPGQYPGQYLTIVTSQRNMHNKHQKALLSSHAKVV